MAATPGHSDLLVTVNLSARQLTDAGLVDVVASALAEADLAPHHLVLEITETMLMQDRDAAAAALWQLKRLGVRIAIDDFGTGYSSLSYLQRFPIDMLKIDKVFVAGLENRASESVLVRTILDLGHTLGLQVVAEGIESSEQLAQLRALGCERGQGYYFARPRNPAATGALLSKAVCDDGLAARSLSRGKT